MFKGMVQGGTIWRISMRIRCAYCGQGHYAPLWYLKLLGIFKTDYYFVCQRCHHYNAFLLRFIVTHDSLNVREKEANKELTNDFVRFFKGKQR